LKRKADFIINLKDCSVDRVQQPRRIKFKSKRSKSDCINDAYNGVNIGIECNREWLQHQIHLLNTKSALIEMRICNRVIIERVVYKKCAKPEVH
jgi:hypothetical protein